MSVRKSNLKCLGCGSDLVYSAKDFALICENCGRLQTFETKSGITTLNYDEKTLQNSLQTKKEKKLTNCKNCGAELEIKEREITKTCPYCGSNFVLDESEILGLKPNNIIPFAFAKDKAVEYYKKNVKHKWFLPNQFKKTPNVDSVFGTYISCFSFDSDTNSKYSGALAVTQTSSHGGEIKEKTVIKHISGTKEYNFRNFLVESSSLTNQNSFDEIKPFIVDDETCRHYDANFLRGYAVESYDNDIKNCKIISEELMKVKIKNDILSKYDYSYVQYFNLTTNFSNNKYSYILVPIYFINFKYKNKSYRTYLNGQTGRIGNDLPKSKVKITFAVLLGILFALLFVFLVFFLD
ncbi:MAG: hypothetical protein ACI4TI_04090 [Christensenellales bacterium]